MKNKFMLLIFFYSCNHQHDELVSNINDLNIENQNQSEYLDSLYNLQTSDSIHFQEMMDSLYNQQINDSLYFQEIVDSLYNQQTNDNLHLDSLLDVYNNTNLEYQTTIDSLQNYDCFGTFMGSAKIDDCGMCTGGTTGLIENYYKDCSGVCGGSSIEYSCGLCSDYNSYNFSEIANYDISILETICDYDDQFTINKEEELTNPDSAFIFIEGKLNNHILLSVPHAHKSFRYDADENTHLNEVYTGAYGKILNNITGVALITSNYKSDDANYYDYIPDYTQTPAFSNMIGDKLPYKAKLDELLLENSNNIFLVIDLHGKNADDFSTYL